MTRWRAPMGVLLASILVLGVTPSVVHAEGDAGTLAAKKHNIQAKKLFNLGLFKEAAVEYEKAYKAKPVPAFLFNLAQCYKRMGKEPELEKAIFYFRGYLKNEPFSPMREHIEKEIKKVEAEIANLRKPKPYYKKWWFWTIVGGVVLTGAAAGITAAALAPEDQKPLDGTGSPGTVGGI